MSRSRCPSRTVPDLELYAGDWRVALRPELGGAVARLDHHGVPVLRPLGDGASTAPDAACFPMIPYANRIAQGRFALHGREYRLPPNFRDEPHSLHGVGWQSAWQVASATPDRAVLSLHHDRGPAWPRRFRAEQRFTVTVEGMTIDLTVINEDVEPMPAGLGLHPYFVCTPRSRLQFAAAGMWHVGDSLLPIEPAAADSLADWGTGDFIGGVTLIDNPYFGWSGSARIDHGDGRAYGLSANGATWLHVLRPPGDASFVCIEPVSHGPDAINRTGMSLLAPGATQHLTMRITST